MKHFIVFAILLLGITYSTYSQSFATARIIEQTSKSQIVVVFETEESKIIPLESFNYAQKLPKIQELLISNQKTINNFFDEMKSNGYEIIEISERTIASIGVSERFVIFEKK